MSTVMLLIWLSPLLALVFVIGVVAVVALVQAESSDVPEVAAVFCSIFRRMVEHVPGAEVATAKPATPELANAETPAGLDAAVRAGEDFVDVAHTVLELAGDEVGGESA